MTKRFLLFSLFVTSIGFSQFINLKESEIPELLCKSWGLDYGISNGTKMPGLETYLNVYTFKNDNTYEITAAEALPSKGNWKYNAEKSRIDLLTDKGIPAGYVTFIDNDYLVLTPDEKSATEGVKLEFIFKPK